MGGDKWLMGWGRGGVTEKGIHLMIINHDEDSSVKDEVRLVIWD